MIRPITFTLFCLAAVLPAATVDEVLAKLDQAAPKFTGMTADVTRVSYTKVIDDKSTESGSMKLKKQGASVQLLIDFTQPDPKSVGFSGKKAEIYYPKLKTVQEYDLGKHTNMIDQFLLIGFGTGKELKASYAVRYVGEETVAGQKAHKLELIPKSQAVKERFRSVDLWIAESGAYPVQQRFVQGTGDYNLATYSNVKLNPPLAPDALKLKLPKGVKREYPQK